VSFSYAATDGDLLSAGTTATITVRPVNDAPVAADGTLIVTADEPAAGQLGGSDVDLDSLSYAVVNVPARGSLTSFGSTTGTYQYTPTRPTSAATASATG